MVIVLGEIVSLLLELVLVLVLALRLVLVPVLVFLLVLVLVVICVDLEQATGFCAILDELFFVGTCIDASNCVDFLRLTMISLLPMERLVMEHWVC